ncbi:MarR family winged helix-turn-helix transcriptional regulator [Nocardioides guangzhouensis]|nr:MarR family transcriptional regulator [Nocardioides guangzhouensis]
MTTAAGPSVDSEITWLLHRAAQRMHVVTSEHAEKHGLSLRDHIVLSALDKWPGLSQVELARAVGLDKTTLMSQLDRLEHQGLVVRRANATDRRARMPEITRAGDRLRARVAEASAAAEAEALSDFTAAEVALLRRMLFELIGDHLDPGSCL